MPHKEQQLDHGDTRICIAVSGGGYTPAHNMQCWECGLLCFDRGAITQAITQAPHLHLIPPLRLHSLPRYARTFS